MDAVPIEEPPEPVNDGPPPHAATPRATTAVTIKAAAVRALARRVRRSA
jgi:hypothetical protein